MEMWEEGGSYEQRDSSSTEFKREVRVLLVDHDQQHLYSLATLFTSCSFNVTAVERASTALQILTERQAEFDLLIADVYLADVNALTLIRLAANMGLQVMLMTRNSLHSMMERALSSGALLLLQKPMSREVLLYVFQTVRREKMRKERESISLDGETRGEIYRCQVKESEGKGHMDESQSTAINYVPKKRGRKPKKRDDGYECGGFGNGTKLKKKTCTEWTEELHAKFMDAVQQLGEGRCYPTNILEIMNVPGLTRMQVASHLQKCRNDKWRNIERKSKRSSNSHPTVPNQVNDNGVIPKSNNKRFGSMPFSENENSTDPNLVQPPKNLNDTNATTEHVDPISPPQPQNLPQPPPQNPPQPFDTHPLFSNNIQIPNVEQNRNHGPLGSLSMSDNASKNVTGSLSSHSMSDNALGNVRGSPVNLSVSDSVSKIVMGPPGNPSMSQNASKNVTESPNSLSMSDNASKDMTMGMVNFNNPFEMSNLNGVHEKFVAPMGMTNQTCYVPVSPDLSMATPGIDHHANSSSYHKVFQSSDDFFDSNREMDEYIQNFSGHPDGSMIYNQSIRTKQVDFDFDPGFPDQFSTGPNGQGPGQWSNSGGTSNFLGE